MPSRDFSLHGAIDLGARQAAMKKQQERQAQAAQRSQAPGGAPGGAPAGPAVVDVTDQTFNTEVVERSQTVPVLVDFWSERSEASKQLGAILEKLAAEAQGQWLLARVEVEMNPQLGAYVQQLGVRGIPFVAAVVGGQMLPFLDRPGTEPQIRQAIGQLFEALRAEGILPEGAAPGAPGAEEPPAADPLYMEAESALQGGDLDGARAAFQQILDANPQDEHARSGIALVDLSLRVRALNAQEVMAEADKNPADAALQTRAADVEMVSGRIEEAFQRLIDTVRRTAGDDRDTARKHLLGLFDVLRPGDPRVAKARRALASALF